MMLTWHKNNWIIFKNFKLSNMLMQIVEKWVKNNRVRAQGPKETGKTHRLCVIYLEVICMVGLLLNLNQPKSLS